MSRAREILELFGDGMLGGSTLYLQKDMNYLKCRSCGYISSMPSGIYGADGLGGTTRASLVGEDDTTDYAYPLRRNKKCPKCGGPMDEVFFSSARVMGGRLHGPRAQTAPGGAFQGGAYH